MSGRSPPCLSWRLTGLSPPLCMRLTSHKMHEEENKGARQRVLALLASACESSAEKRRRAATQPLASETATATASPERPAAVLTNQGVWRGSRGGTRQEMKLSVLLPWAASVQTNRGGISVEEKEKINNGGFDFNGFHGQEWLLFNFAGRRLIETTWTSRVPALEATARTLRATAEDPRTAGLVCRGHQHERPKWSRCTDAQEAQGSPHHMCSATKADFCRLAFSSTHKQTFMSMKRRCF